MNIYKEFLTTLLLIEITEIEIDTASFTFLLFYFFTFLPIFYKSLQRTE